MSPFLLCVFASMYPFSVKPIPLKSVASQTFNIKLKDYSSVVHFIGRYQTTAVKLKSIFLWLPFLLNKSST